MKLVFKQKKKKCIVSKGGAGSGHHGHAGRPGKVGGSSPGSGGGVSLKKLEKGKYKIIRYDDDEEYMVLRSNLKDTGWVIERQSDLAVYPHYVGSLNEAKLIIGKWGYF